MITNRNYDPELSQALFREIRSARRSRALHRIDAAVSFTTMQIGVAGFIVNLISPEQVGICAVAATLVYSSALATRISNRSAAEAAERIRIAKMKLGIF